jgi:tetratricopeptide (TPR) repeat protein
MAPEEVDALLARAAELVQQSEFEEAVALYADLVSRAPADARPEAAWAWALLLDGQGEQAVEHAHRAVELDPVSAETTSVLARAYLAAGDRGRARAMAQSAVELDEASAQAHAALAEVLRLDGQLEQALAQVDLALAKAPNSAEAHRIRGWLYLARADAEGALRELQAAADLEPGFWLRQHELGLVQLELGDHEAALVSLKNALALRSKPETQRAIGQAYHGQGESDQARAFLEQSLAAGTPEASTYGLLGLIAAEEGDCDDAEAYALQAQALEAEQPLAQQALELCQGPPPLPTDTTVPTEPPAFVSPLAEPPLRGTIAFPVWNAQRSSYDTYLAQAADGSQRRLLLENASQPAFSGGGGWLALNGERHLQENLLIVRPNGSDLLEITEHTEDGLPSWSPDGKSLAFSSTRHGDRQSRVYVIDSVPYDGTRAQGRPLKAGLYDARGAHPVWTADRQILFSGCDYGSTPAVCGLLLMPAGPGPQTATPITDYGGDSAPDVHRQKIAFMSNRDGDLDIYVVNLDGSGLQRLTESSAQDGLPAWAPDGRTIAFVSDEGGVWAVWAVDADGENRRKLFDIGGEGLGANWRQERISWGPPLGN